MRIGCLADHQGARHPGVPALVANGDEHIFELGRFGRLGDAREHLHAGCDLDRVAIVVGIATGRQEPTEFEGAHGLGLRQSVIGLGHVQPKPRFDQEARRELEPSAS
jgi:hypothetical protein